MRNLHAIFMAGLLLCTGLGAEGQHIQNNSVKLPNTTPALLPQALNPQLRTTSTTIQVPQTELEYSWSAATAAWTPVYEKTYEYDNRGWPTQQITKDLAEDKPSTLVMHMYDAQGRDTLLTVQEDANGTWVNASRIRTKYDAHGHLTYMGAFRWHNAAWQLVHANRYTYTFGPGNRVEQVVKQLYSGTNWTDMSKEGFTYTGNSALPGTKTEYINTEIGWMPTQRFVNITYVPENQREQSYTKQSWVGAAWQNVSMHTFTYTTNSTTFANITEEEVYRYTGTSTVLERKIMEEYLPSGQFMQHKEEVLINGRWLVDTENSLMGFGVNEPQGGGFTEFTYQTFSYTPQGHLSYINYKKHTYSNFVNILVTSHGEELPATAVTLYPNPTKDMLHISLHATTAKEAAVSIYNLTGQKVAKTAIIHSEGTINLSHLPSGIYVVNVKDNNSSSMTKKIVKQ
ncbi:T9SS type A sorting domain-containing protein [Pontibacter qinzhouensis]|uniref:T9SS type A sorting domain-containing protein n=1 Tax=Pontibacter qinzhouensis TaxID=2603253 RepID=A0A5C8KBE4_9BACT|nr:T9SS type A sorting domain-containing protein [Pontibacter qinzhouensis]TXK52821.1 T9SS type A sorting domain-containing protein [Pontibacter qinzhouensis]